ncbi:MAG: PAS domain S-box protein [Syntrophobacteraceae bacterium]
MEEEKLRPRCTSLDNHQIVHPSVGCPPDTARVPPNQLLEIIEFLPDATFVVDKEGEVIAWNSAMEEMTGVPKFDILGKGGYLYAVPFYGESRPIVIDYAMGKAEGIESSYSYLERDGDTFFAETFCPLLYGGRGAFLWAKASPLYDLDRNIIGAVESIRDITARRNAEEALRKSEEKYRLIFHNTPLGIFHFDTTGTATDCNDNIIEIWGSSRERFIGFNLLSSVKNKKMKAAVKSCLAGKCACYEGSYLSVTGGKITKLKADFGPIMSDDGRVIGGIGIIEDISERRAAEAAVEDSEARLRLLAADLITAQENERKNIARELHDNIGSLLTGVKFSIENALDLAKKGQFHHESLKSMKALVQHAIDESRRIVTDLRPTILDDLGIVSTIRWFTRHFQSLYSALKFTAQIGVEEEEVPEYLKIVIFRIIQECFHCIVKHGRVGIVDITLRKDGSSIVMRIEKDGAGLDPEILSGKGLTLFSIKERAELSGGCMVTGPGEGGRTLIEVRWPHHGEECRGDESFSRYQV